MKMFSYLSVLQLFMLMSVAALSNNIVVQNVSLENQVAAEHYVSIEFDLSWDNSWRTQSIPNNWDAAWIFCKYRLAGGVWNHVKLHVSGHTAPAGATIDVAGDTTGAFIYRDADGYGTNTWENIRLRWDYGNQGVNDDAAMEVKVFAIEMVYVPQGNFYLGDGTSSDRFFMGDNNATFYQVTSENAITVIGTSSNLWAMGNISTGTIPEEYPKGYTSFYLMKYELSQEQYIEFLNTLTRVQQNTRTEVDISTTTPSNVYVMTDASGTMNRNGIYCEPSLPATAPVTFFANYDQFGNEGALNDILDGQNIACNYIGWADVAAYLDWSGLRPMTELEFEKACRGPNNPVGGEFAWGNTLIQNAPYISGSDGMANEFFLNLENTGNCLYSSTIPQSDWVVGRCGIFAASSNYHTRMETGAAYYGIMEMSGWVWECCVNAVNSAGRSFTGLHGNGALLPSGDADVDYWPGINGNSAEGVPNTTYQSGGVTSYGGAGARGGDISNSADGLPISYRGYTSGQDYAQRTRYTGGRGCRTTP